MDRRLLDEFTNQHRESGRTREVNKHWRSGSGPTTLAGISSFAIVMVPRAGTSAAKPTTHLHKFAASRNDSQLSTPSTPHQFNVATRRTNSSPTWSRRERVTVATRRVEATSSLSDAPTAQDAHPRTRPSRDLPSVTWSNPQQSVRQFPSIASSSKAEGQNTKEGIAGHIW